MGYFNNKKDWFLLIVASVMVILNLISYGIDKKADLDYAHYKKLCEEKALEKMTGDEVEDFILELEMGSDILMKSLGKFMIKLLYSGVGIGAIIIIPKYFFEWGKDDFFSNYCDDINIVNGLCWFFIIILTVYDFFSPLSEILLYRDLAKECCDVIYNLNFDKLIESFTFSP